MQVRDRNDKPNILKDKDRTVLYNGPLAVMVNEFSASASEIFAAAIQDYGRGVIIGSTSTARQGTVQRNIGLDQNSFFHVQLRAGNSKTDASEILPRINGGSTQLRGVSSDVVLPDQYEYLKSARKDDPDAFTLGRNQQIALFQLEGYDRKQFSN